MSRDVICAMGTQTPRMAAQRHALFGCAKPRMKPKTSNNDTVTCTSAVFRSTYAAMKPNTMASADSHTVSVRIAAPFHARRGQSFSADDGVDLDLHQHRRIQKLTHLDHRGCGPDIAEVLGMRFPDAPPL